jgi:hypothetical protein
MKSSGNLLYANYHPGIHTLKDIISKTPPQEPAHKIKKIITLKMLALSQPYGTEVAVEDPKFHSPRKTKSR